MTALVKMLETAGETKKMAVKVKELMDRFCAGGQPHHWRQVLLRVLCPFASSRSAS